MASEGFRAFGVDNKRGDNARLDTERLPSFKKSRRVRKLSFMGKILPIIEVSFNRIIIYLVESITNEMI
jgi:hypothetical protein